MSTADTHESKSESDLKRESKSGKHHHEKSKKRSELDFFRDELERVKENVNEYNSSLNPPKQEPFIPYIFNPLKPYTDTRMFETAINEPPESQHFPVSRRTALGPCDPWISLEMDLVITASIPSTARQSARQDRQNSSRGGEKTNRSTKKEEDKKNETDKTKDKDKKKEEDKTKDKDKKKEEYKTNDKDRKKEEDRTNDKDKNKEEGRTSDKDRKKEEGRTNDKDRKKEEGRTSDKDRKKEEGRTNDKDRKKEEDRTNDKDRKKEEDRTNDKDRKKEEGRTNDKDRKKETDKTKDKDKKKDADKTKDKNKNRDEDKEEARIDLYPTITPLPSQYHGQTLHYGQVKELRQELKKTYSTDAERRVDEEYQKTKKYFYNRELDKMEEYREINRDNMRATYFAYLQNNPGSKKAVHECVRDSEKKEDKKADKKEKTEKEKADKENLTDKEKTDKENRDKEKADKEKREKEKISKEKTGVGKSEDRREPCKKSEETDKVQGNNGKINSKTVSKESRDPKDGRTVEKEPPKNKNEGLRSDDDNKNRETDREQVKKDGNHGKSEDKGNSKKDVKKGK